jgi:hypothetical protein
MPITIKIMGGLGNQIFQWAFGRALEISAPGQVQYDISWFDGNVSRTYLLSEIGLRNLKLVRGSTGRIVDEWTLRYCPEILKLAVGNVFLRGYWQCEKYFEHIQQQIRSEVFQGMTLGEGTKAVADQITKMSHSAFLHVRRSDNRTPGSGAFHGLISKEYCLTAVNYIRERVPDVHFFVFSDEPEWCKENFTGMTIVDCNPMSGTVNSDGSVTRGKPGREVEDLYLMSLCEHGIVSNSSFSWWGAWLNPREEKQDRIIVAPKAWFVVGAERADSSEIPPAWWTRL